MTKVTRGALLFAFAVLLFAAAGAQAQTSCYSCDPYGPCGVSCSYCRIDVDPEYGVCPFGYEEETTCDDFIGACENCTPEWQTTERVHVGYYGETTYGVECDPWPYCFPTFGCDHHIVDRVTQTDANQCNINSSYWQRQFCDDYSDFSLPHRVGSPPNCCGYPYFCNDWHSCF